MPGIARAAVASSAGSLQVTEIERWLSDSSFTSSYSLPVFLVQRRGRRYRRRGDRGDIRPAGDEIGGGLRHGVVAQDTAMAEALGEMEPCTRPGARDACPVAPRHDLVVAVVDD